MNNKFLPFFLFGMLFSVVSWAQTPSNKLTLGFELGLPLGDFSTVHDAGTGVSLIYHKAIGASTYFTGNLGYMRFSGKVRMGSTDMKFKSDRVPVKVGLKHYVSNGFYGAAEMGVAISTGAQSTGVAFAYSPAIGRDFALGNKSKLDLGLRYESWLKNGHSNFIGLRTALSFGI